MIFRVFRVLVLIILVAHQICFMACSRRDTRGYLPEDKEPSTDSDSASDSDTGEEEVDTSAPLKAVTLKWLRCFHDDQDGRDNEAWSVASAQNGDLFVGGEFHGTELGDSYLIALDSLGNTQKAFQYTPGVVGESYRIKTKSLVLDSAGNIYATGYFNGLIDIETTDSLGIPLSSLGSTDVFLAKISQSDGPVWANTAGGLDSENGSDITIDSGNRLIVAGSVSPPATFGQGQPGEIVLPILDGSVGTRNIFAAAFDEAGILDWARQDGSTSGDLGSAVVTSNDGSIYVAGMVKDDAVFGLGEGTETTVYAAGVSNACVARYSNNGEFQWVAPSGGNAMAIDIARDVALTKTGSIVIVGEYGGAAVFGEGQANETTLHESVWMDSFIASYREDGFLEWAKWFGGIYDDSAPALAVNDENIFVVGVASRDSIFGKDELNQSIMPYMSGQMYIADYNFDGTLKWLSGIHGSQGTFFHDNDYTKPQDVIVLWDGSLIVVGRFRGDVVLGNNADGEAQYCNAETDGAFVAKYIIDGPVPDLP